MGMLKTFKEISDLADMECTSQRDMVLDDPPPTETVWIFNEVSMRVFTKKLLESAEKRSPADYKAFDQFRKQRKMIFKAIKMIHSGQSIESLAAVEEVLRSCTCDAEGGELHKDECLKWVWTHLDR